MASDMVGTQDGLVHFVISRDVIGEKLNCHM